jgi:hypothetical protein
MKKKAADGKKTRDPAVTGGQKFDSKSFTENSPCTSTTSASQLKRKFSIGNNNGGFKG